MKAFSLEMLTVVNQAMARLDDAGLKDLFDKAREALGSPQLMLDLMILIGIVCEKIAIDRALPTQLAEIER